MGGYGLEEEGISMQGSVSFASVDTSGNRIGLSQTTVPYFSRCRLGIVTSIHNSGDDLEMLLFILLDII